MKFSWFCIPRQSVQTILSSVSVNENKELSSTTLRTQVMEPHPPTPPKSIDSPRTSVETSDQEHNTTRPPPTTFLQRWFGLERIQR